MRPGLLVSVRSGDEAKSALAGGADLIDVKEPTRGPLGAADFSVMRKVLSEVDGRTPVSVALGEWRDWIPRPLPKGVTYAKWGLSGSATSDADAISHFHSAQPVLVAYADAKRASSPGVMDLVDAACELRFSAFLLDTAIKDGAGLLEWISVIHLVRIRRKLAKAHVRFALAGSLDAGSIERLVFLSPNWFAVRGAACEGGREGEVCSNRVKHLKGILDSPQARVAAG